MLNQVKLFQIPGSIQRRVVHNRPRLEPSRLPLSLRLRADTARLRPDGIRSGTASTGSTEPIWRPPLAGRRLRGADVLDEPAIEPDFTSTKATLYHRQTCQCGNFPW